MKVINGEKRQLKKEPVKIKSGMLEIYLGQQGQSLLNRSFPVKVNYWLARIFEKFRQEFKTYFKQKQNIINKYKEENPKENLPKGQVKIQEKLLDKFNDDMEQFQNIEIELEGIYRIEIDQNDMPQLTIKEMELLLPILNIKGLL